MKTWFLMDEKGRIDEVVLRWDRFKTNVITSKIMTQAQSRITLALLRTLRESVESTRLEIQGWSFTTPSTEAQSEAMALRKLAERSSQQARQWVGKMIGELGAAYPYPQSLDASNTVIDATTVQGNLLYAGTEGDHIIQRIKRVRAVVKEFDQNLDALPEDTAANSRFNAYRFEAQRHLIGSGMWLGELLHQFTA